MKEYESEEGIQGRGLGLRGIYRGDSDSQCEDLREFDMMPLWTAF